MSHVVNVLQCLTSWHQIRKCLRHCLRFAYACTGFAYAHILSYAELPLVNPIVATIPVVQLNMVYLKYIKI